jgi:membrane protease YdiL (CAAX protease family)
VSFVCRRTEHYFRSGRHESKSGHLTGTRRLQIVGGLLLTLGPVLVHANQFGQWFLGMTPLQSRDLLWWPLTLVILLYIVGVERLPLSSIGIRKPTWLTPAIGVAVALVMLYAMGPLIDMAVAHFIPQSNASSAPAGAIAATPLWYRVLLVTRASLSEEIIFRGYVIQRIEELTGSRILAAAVSVAAFAYAHFAYWGWVPLISVSIGGLVLALLYIWRRDLIANMIVHFVFDGLQLFF